MENYQVYKVDAFVSGLFERLDEITTAVLSSQDWHYNLWEAAASRDEWLDYIWHLDPEVTPERWGVMWDKRTILAPKFEDAQIELINALLGWW